MNMRPCKTPAILLIIAVFLWTSVLCAQPRSTVLAPATSCTSAQLRSLIVSSWWASIENFCRADEDALELNVAPPPGYSAEMWTALRAHCREHSGARFACGLTEFQRSGLLSQGASALYAARGRRAQYANMCPQRERMVQWVVSAPENRRARLQESLGVLQQFCAALPSDSTARAAPNSLPILGLTQTEGLEELYAVTIRGRVGNINPETPNAQALWRQDSIEPLMPTSLPLLPRTTPRMTWGSTRIATAPSLTPTPGVPAPNANAQNPNGQSAGAAPMSQADATVSATATLNANASTSISSASLSASGVMDMALQGLTQLLVSRAQAEVEAFALDQLRNLLCSDRARPWFEHTCGYLVDAGRGSALRVSLGSGLRTAFQADVLALPTRAAQQAPHSGSGSSLVYRTFFELVTQFIASPDTRSLSTVVISVADGFRCTQDELICENTRQAMQGSGLMLFATASRPDMERMTPELYGSFIETVLGRRPSDNDRALVTELRLAGQRLRAAFGSITAGNQSVEIALPRIAGVARGLIEVLNLATRLAVTDEAIAQVVTLPDRLAQLVLAIGRGNLPHIVIETVRIVSHLGRGSFGLPDNVARGLVLAAEIAQAQSPEQVRAALETVVAPVGSWRLKRTRFMLSLSGMVGLSGGMDYVVGGGISGGSLVPSVGLIGAVGLDVSFPAGSSTLGVFASAIDVGGLMTFPLNDLTATVRDMNGTTRSATLQFNARVSPEQILSPGLYLRWGLFNSPFVFGVGASVVPNARRAEEVGMLPAGSMPVTRDISIVRAQAFLAVDVTLFPF